MESRGTSIENVFNKHWYPDTYTKIFTRSLGPQVYSYFAHLFTFIARSCID